MTEEPPRERSQQRPRAPLPIGYRQGIITAITVLLGFSLLFMRYWNLELPGVWTPSALTAALLIALSIVLQMITLWRSLQIEDDDESEYRKTLRWFLSSVVVLMLGVVLSFLSYARILRF